VQKLSRDTTRLSEKALYKGGGREREREWAGEGGGEREGVRGRGRERGAPYGGLDMPH
jgi:hypothetical protein